MIYGHMGYAAKQENKIMKASEARKLAEEKLSAPLKQIIEDIAKKAKTGVFEMWYYKDMPISLREKLIELDYTVAETMFDQSEGTYVTKISW